MMKVQATLPPKGKRDISLLRVVKIKKTTLFGRRSLEAGMLSQILESITYELYII